MRTSNHVLPPAFGTGASVIVDRCQVCGSTKLQPVVFLGFLPPVNQMRPIGEPPHEQPGYPAQLLRCLRCQLAQLGLVVDPKIIFPPEYPYTSGTTRILRDNFAELYREATSLTTLKAEDLVVDIGSNDGTLLGNFAGRHRVLGVEPSQIGELARAKGISTWTGFFGPAIARRIKTEHGPAKLITAANVFAHIENVHAVLDALVSLLDRDGVFISESHYLLSLIETLQYDTIYHEHLRYYSLASLEYLLRSHGLEIFHAKKIPTHGGSIRVYAARSGRYPRSRALEMLREAEADGLSDSSYAQFGRRVTLSKLKLQALLYSLKSKGRRIYGIGAPSRASTLINHVGIDDGILDCVLEVKGSHKIGKYMPGTLIPVVEESRLFEDPPDCAVLLSWHIADELAPKLRAKGFTGDFVVPLPEPRIIARSRRAKRGDKR